VPAHSRRTKSREPPRGGHGEPPVPCHANSGGLPGARTGGHAPHPGARQSNLPAKFVLPPSLALRTLRRGGAVVYRVEGDLLRNETNRYRAIAETEWRDETPRFIDIGDPIFAEFLEPGWSQAADGYRSMLQTASLRIGAPHGAGESLYIGVFRTRDFALRLGVDGAAAALPPSAPGRPPLELSLATDLNQPLTFGYAEIR
jgi:hypothetical protein